MTAGTGALASTTVDHTKSERPKVRRRGQNRPAERVGRVIVQRDP
ncbi:hypothetical protein PSAB6_460080 [Paraburkholderia sabiae]|nr:hypothetical protein PSAB6_460080 [Paraburkholderia sabiae]